MQNYEKLKKKYSGLKIDQLFGSYTNYKPGMYYLAQQCNQYEGLGMAGDPRQILAFDDAVNALAWMRFAYAVYTIGGDNSADNGLKNVEFYMTKVEDKEDKERYKKGLEALDNILKMDKINKNQIEETVKIFNETFVPESIQAHGSLLDLLQSEWMEFNIETEEEKLQKRIKSGKFDENNSSDFKAAIEIIDYVNQN